MQTPYYTLEEMLEMIEEPNRTACKNILADNLELFQTVQGGAHNHHTWAGGYYDHIQEVMNIGIVLYQQLNSLRPLPFTLSDLLLVLYLHDIEKPWRYELKEGKLHNKKDLQDKESQNKFRIQKLKEYGVKLTPEHQNGIKYTEGEGNDYTMYGRVMNELACLAHMSDVCSARLWFDYPQETDDTWPKDKRVSKIRI
jgi:hypothetical protein